MKTKFFISLISLLLLAACNPAQKPETAQMPKGNMVAIALDISGSISQSAKNDQTAFLCAQLKKELTDSASTEIYTSRIFKGQSMNNLKKIVFAPELAVVENPDDEQNESDKMLTEVNRKQQIAAVKKKVIKNVLAELFTPAEKAQRSSILEYLPLLAELRKNTPDKPMVAYILSDMVECSDNYRNMIAKAPQSDSEAVAFAKQDLGRLRVDYFLKKDALHDVKILVLLPPASGSQQLISPFLQTYWHEVFSGLGAVDFHIIR
ncbi:MAG: hypothetical protein V4543_07560 [Bacteroidota bacterium]